MTSPADLERKFWKALASERTLMLGLRGSADLVLRPMTAQLDDGQPGPVWFFTAKDSALVQQLSSGSRAIASFVAKDHDLFASVQGTLAVESNLAMIDRLWNRFVAAWYEGGKDDPKLALLRLDPDHGEIWLNGSSLMAGVKMMLGFDPKRDYQDKVAKVNLHH